ncbi:transmembrane protein 245 isoform X2 [Fopius arisanus]|uniref:Transmembrane protein 245 isoform X2 n=1 Tax=Fopius arisanus TaxID=64838 RepID=A0A9R1T381_9HYME|nr:PREDICTED: transmembrane protein 245 isoform X2 [Fopius arisanus]
MEGPRTPMDNLLNVLSGFSVGHEKALKQGIYNAVALLVLFLTCAATYGLYLILHPFVKPLIWALLCGSVLFPFKLYITTSVQSWFTETENSHEPLLVDLAMLPIRITDRISNTIGNFLHQRLNYVGVLLGIISGIIMIYWYTPGILLCLIWRLMQLVMGLTSTFITTCNIYIISSLILGYLSAVYVYWTPRNAQQFNYFSIILWLILSLYISNILGVYEVPVFIALQTLFIVGFTYEVILIMETKDAQDKPLTFAEAVQVALAGEEAPQEVKSSEERDEGTDTFPESTSTPKLTPEQIKEPSPRPQRLSAKSLSLDADSDKFRTTRLSGRSSSFPNARVTVRERYFLRKLRTELRMSLDAPEDEVDTDKYMYGAIYACGGMLLWKHKWILGILTLPIVWYFLKLLGSRSGFWRYLQGQMKRLVEFIKAWSSQRQQALVPAHVRGLYRVYLIVDKGLRDILKGSVDAVATIAVIFALIVFTFSATIFITVQIYGEGLHLIQVTGEILNSSLVNNPDIDWVPEQWEESVNSVLDNAYTYGRSAISDGIKGLVKDLEPTKAEALEKKVLELWDRLYQAWMMSNEDPGMIGPTVDVEAALTAWESIKESFGKIPTQIFNMTGIQNFAKENVGILMQVLDSVWGIVKGNMSVLVSVLTELMYIVFMSGSALLNFTLSTVVFFTTLFYLLSSSGKTYKPIELIAVFSPISCYRFAIALQEAVIAVFAATFKLASFFGMWTWFIHNLFQVKIVYLPSVFATVLAAVPFLDAYFACLPATLELWFTRGPMIAVIFFVFHFLPCNIVITDFYKEIKGGGHPYLTGLSIAGGIFCLGVEGAIFGPLLLCCIMVAINLSRKYMQSVSEETLHSLKTQIDQLEAEPPVSP